jgi:hypothetical protein
MGPESILLNDLFEDRIEVQNRVNQFAQGIHASHSSHFVCEHILARDGIVPDIGNMCQSRPSIVI